MFTNNLNHRLVLYISPCPDPAAMSVNVLVVGWPRNAVLYAFPPTTIIDRVLHKIVRERTTCLLVIAPSHWKRRGTRCYSSSLRRDVSAFPSDPGSTPASPESRASASVFSTCTCGASISRPGREGFQTQSSSGFSVSTPCPPTRCTNLIDESFNPGVLSVATALWLPH